MFILPEDPYKVLGVAKDSQLPEIRSAHRKLVLKCHPDKVVDPQLKAIKQDEFQKVQQAYELLSDDNERTKYDNMVRANEMEKENARTRAKQDAAYGRTPRRGETFLRYNINVRTAEQNFEEPKRSSAFPTSSPYGHSRTPNSSHEDHIHTSSGESFREPRSSRKKQSERDQRNLKHDEEKRRRKQDKQRDRDWENTQELAKQREREIAAEEARLRREKEKRPRRKVEEVEPQPAAHNYDTRGPVIIDADDRKTKASAKSKRNPSQAPVSETEKKQQEFMDFAYDYLTASRNKAGRHHDHSPFIRSVSPTPAVPTPPPATAFAKPPPADETDIHVEEDDVRRKSAKTLGRRGSGDSARARDKVSSSHKKTSYLRDDVPMPGMRKSNTMPSSHYVPLVPDSPPRDPPKVSRSKTEMPQYARPIPVPMPGMNRSQTWYPQDDHERSRERPRQARDYSDGPSEDERRYLRSSRRERTPEPMPRSTIRSYKFDQDQCKATPIKAVYLEASSPSAKAYYEPFDANIGRPLEHRRRPALHTHETHSGTQVFRKVKTTPWEDVNYGQVHHAPHLGDPGYAF